MIELNNPLAKSEKESSYPFMKIAEEKAQMQQEMEAMQRQIAKLVAAAEDPKAKKKSRAPVMAETRAKLADAMMARNAAKHGENNVTTDAA